MVQLVKLPDGTQVNFPDSMSADDIQKAMQTFTPKAKSDDMPAAGQMVKTAAESLASVPANVADLVHSAGDKLADKVMGDNLASQQYEENPATQDTKAINQGLEQDIQKTNSQTGTVNLPVVGKVGGGDVANLVGQGVGLGGAASKLGGAISGLASKVLPSLPSWLAGSAAAGAASGAALPTGGDTADESLSNRAGNAKTGAVVGPIAEGVVNGLGAAKSTVGESIGKRSKSGAENALGNDLNNFVGDEGRQALQATVDAGNPNGLTTAEVTQNPDVAKMQRDVAGGKPLRDEDGNTVNPANVLGQKNQTAKDNLVNQIQGINAPDANPQGIAQAAKSEVNTQKSNIDQEVSQAQEASDKANATESGQNTALQMLLPKEYEAGATVGKSAMDASNTARQGYAAEYAKADPKGDVLTHLGADTKATVEDITKDNTTSPDIRDILKKYTGGEPVSVKQIIQDKNDLNTTISDLNNDLTNKNFTGSSAPIKAQIETARAAKDALYDHLESLDTVPAGGDPSRTVSDVVKSAEGQFKDFQRNMLENPDQVKSGVSAQGTPYTRASQSAFGEYDYKLQKGIADSASEEGSKLLPVQDAGSLSASLNNIKNLPESGTLLKDQILGRLSTAVSKGQSPAEAFNNIYNPSVRKVIQDHGYTAEDSELSALGQDLQDTSAKSQSAKAALSDAQTQAAQKLATLDQHNWSKLSDLPPDVQTDMLLKDKSAMQDALELANKQNDGGSSLRGLGNNVIDRIRANSLSSKPGMNGEETGTLNRQAFSDSLKANEEVLKATVPEEYEALQTANKVASQLDYVQKGSKPEGAAGTKDNPTANEDIGTVGLKEIGVHAGVYNTIVNTIDRILRTKSSDQYRSIMLKLTDPQEALRLMNNAKSDGQAGVTDWVNSHTTSADTAIGVDSKRDKSLENDVSKAMPQKKASNDIPTTAPQANPSTGVTGKPTSTEAPKSSTPPVDSHAAVIQEASRLSGMPASYIQRVHNSETKGMSDPDSATNSSSTATGRGQFIESTWNDLASKHPSANIPLVTPQNIDTRSDPRLNERYSTIATGLYGADNKDQIQKVLNRPVTEGDVVLAHKFGAAGAKTLLKADPGAAASSVLPSAVQGNESLFFNKKGQALSVKQLYALVERSTT